MTHPSPITGPLPASGSAPTLLSGSPLPCEPLATDPALASPSLHPKIVKAGHGQCLELPGETRHILLDSHDTGGQVALSHVAIQPGTTTPLHIHTREDELFFITEGRFLFNVGGAPFEVGPGDFIFAPRHIPHTYRCTSETAGQMLIWVLSAGFEDFFRAQALAQDLTAALLTAMAAQFGVRIGDDTTGLEPKANPRVLQAQVEAETTRFRDLTHPQTPDAEVIRAYGDTVHVLVPEATVEGRYCFVYNETPSLSGPPLHIHEKGDEVFVILEGRYEFSIGDARVQVGAGDALFAPRCLPHCFRVISGEPGRALILALPGDFEAFFRESATLFAQGLMPDALMPRLLEIWSRYNLTFV